MMRFQSALIAVGVLAASLVMADDNLDESKAIEKIEKSADQKPPVSLSVKIRLGTQYDVASRIGNEDKKAGGESKSGMMRSKNHPVQLLKDEKGGEEGKLSLIVDEQENPLSFKYEGVRVRGIRVRLVNRTGGRVTLSAIDSYLYMSQEAQDEDGKWKAIECTHPGTGPRDCGVGMDQVFLEPNEFWNITAPRYSGSIKTKLRFRLNTSGKAEGTILYSEPFDGGVNPEQLRP